MTFVDWLPAIAQIVILAVAFSLALELVKIAPEARRKPQTRVIILRPKD